jgi:hypothetical protein
MENLIIRRFRENTVDKIFNKLKIKKGESYG